MNKTQNVLLFALALLPALLCGSCGNKQQPTAQAIDTLGPIAEGIYREPMEGYELIVIQDKATTQSAKLFANTAPDTLLQRLMPTGEAESSINVVLLANDERNILFDAGLGAAKGGLLLNKLQALYLKPEEVTAILLTHLHGDHIGGLVHNGAPSFPYADLYINIEEYEAWINGPLSKDNEEVMEILSYYAPRLQLFQYGDTILGNIIAHNAAGHTPGHTLYEVGGLLIGGDLLHAPVLQRQHPEISCAYDFDPAQAAATRQHWLRVADSLGHNLYLMHEPIEPLLEIDVE